MIFLSKISKYKVSVVLSSASVVFGIFRELIIIGLLGLTVINDRLQLYLSIFYSISLSTDAIRLAALNLIGVMPLNRILLSMFVAVFPYSVLMGLMFYYIVPGAMTLWLASIAVLGGFLNLVMSLLITYKQRQGMFLRAQCINVLPNFILIPGTVFVYFLFPQNIINSLVLLCVAIPLFQIILLLSIQIDSYVIQSTRIATIFQGSVVFLKQGLSSIGEQIFQVILRTCFFKISPGYLSLLSILLRVFLAGRFVLIDSYIGYKLYRWKDEIKRQKDIWGRLSNMQIFNQIVLLVSFCFTYQLRNGLPSLFIQLSLILVLGFYFDAIVKVNVYKINNIIYDPKLVVMLGILDIGLAIFMYALQRVFILPPLILVWLWFVCRMGLKLFYIKDIFKAFDKI